MTSRINFHVISLFPEAFRSYLDVSVVARAVREKKIKIKFYNPRDFVVAKNRAGYKQVDDRPFGGGPGMVMLARPILNAVARVKSKIKNQKSKVVIFNPSGAPFTNQVAETIAKKTKHLILICGRYEGIDARVKKILRAEEWSVGPYVLTGGELPALVVLDAIARRLPAVLGNDESVEERRVSSAEVYTRPEVLAFRGKKFRVPKILLSGHHARIEAWKQQKQKPA